ncbi:MAG: ATP-binding protein [Mycoplasmataceae bacterium]|jgi:predicted AAA+ superfamily ATPase|nr:ATP-binding protein [Mycoplasmataceae bacterium]
MNYITRHIEALIKDLCKTFPSLMIIGARQAGKSTTLENIYGRNNYITFDNLQSEIAAKNDGLFFLKQNSYPLILDEIHYVPSLFRDLKIMIDEIKENGMYLITDSQQYSAIRELNESLSGRIALIKLLPLSIREKYDLVNNGEFIPDNNFISKIGNKKTEDITKDILIGGYPKICSNHDINISVYFESYINTYIEKDVKKLNNIEDSEKFLNFLKIIASKSGQQINYSSISKEIRVSMPTVERWTMILQSSNIIHILQPFYKNSIEKSLYKTPKIYFIDTGLLCHLLHITNIDVLKNHFLFGSIFETFVVSEILKSYTNVGKNPDWYYFRDKKGNEIDLILKNGLEYYAIEIKSNDNVSYCKQFENVASLYKMKFKTNIIISNTNSIKVVGGGTYVLPAFLI